jgi:high-affinity iron transporter
VVSILLAAVRRSDKSVSTTPIWAGVVAALSLALSFGAILTFTRADLPVAVQEIFAGTLSVLAVVFVTGMVFWMRRTARGLSNELGGQVTHALSIGTGALALTAFLAVGREGLETALFMWTTVQSSGETVIPLIGAAIGIVAAVVLCWLLYRSSVRINLGKFFERTAIFLIVIAAGVLAYGLGDLQNGGLLSGRTWTAFDLSSHVSSGSWWATIITGVTNLQVTMTWLQVVAYVVYLVAVLAVFLRKTTVAPAPIAAEEKPQRNLTGRRGWSVVIAAIIIPILTAGGVAIFLPRNATAANQTVKITDKDCGAGLANFESGQQDFAVANSSSVNGEIYFLRTSDQAVVGEIENLGPSTTRTISVKVPAGTYQFKCVMSGKTTLSATLTASGASTGSAPVVVSISEADLAGPVSKYQDYAATQLVTFAAQVTTLNNDLAAGNLAAAQNDWKIADLSWERVGASYGSFGDYGNYIGGIATGLPDGVNDSGFTGLHRIEYGLWHGQSASTLLPIGQALSAKIVDLQAHLGDVTFDLADLPIRVHEILEDASRDHLNGLTDYGAGNGFDATRADVDVTRIVLGLVTDLLNKTKPGLVATISTELDAIDAALPAAGTGPAVATVPLATRQAANAAVGEALETLSLVPDLLEVRK